MRRYSVAVLLVVAMIGLGSTLGVAQGDQPKAAAAASDGAVVAELRAIRRELQKLNANVGTRYRDAPLITQLSDIKRSTEYTCKSVATSASTPC